MASPSLATVENIIAQSLELIDDRLTDAAAYVTDEDVVLQALEGDGPIIDRLTDSVQALRNRFAGVVSNQQAAEIVGAGFQLYVRHVTNTPGALDIQRAATKIYEHMIDNKLRVQSRNFTYGTIVASGGNIGNGVILRTTADERGFAFENTHADAKRAWVRRDQNSGVFRHEEEFTFRGESSLDALQVVGSGLEQPGIKAPSSNQSLLSNASFDRFAGTAAAPTGITSWTSSVAVNATNYDFDSTNFYRSHQGAGTDHALNVKVTSILTQRLTVRGTRLRPGRPYMLQVAWNRAVGGATGTLLARMGSQFSTVTVSAQTGFQLLRVPGTTGSGNWLLNFNEDQLDIEIAWTRTAGELLIDDIMFIEGQRFDGLWYFPIGGSTPWVGTAHDGDFFTWTDTVVESILQRWFHRGPGRYMPHALIAPTGAATAALAGAGAGNVDDGTHSWVITFSRAESSESSQGPKSNVLTVVDKSVDGQVSLTGIPTGPGGTESRSIYRTIAGDTGDHLLVGTINDNTTTIFTDNVADASLDIGSPAGVTWSEP